MSDGFEALAIVKQVLIKHLLRQQVEQDLIRLRQVPLNLTSCLTNCLDRIHASLLAAIADHKRELRRHGVRIITQEKNSLDFRIAYVERGYQVQHCFLLATLQAEAHLLLSKMLEGGSYEFST